jgi:hypothetical protein
MHSNRRNPSYTLPRNFTFHYTDGEIPQTPQEQIVSEAPRQIGPYRLRRRTREPGPMPSDHFIPHNTRDVPIPTIEVSDSTTQPLMLRPAPIISSRPRGSPPRTPIPQILPDTQDEDTTMDSADIRSQGESISRPSTACSGFSDSSVSSSIESFPSLGGSFTSPECDVLDHQHKASDCANGKRLVQNSTAVQGSAIPRSNQTGVVKHPWTEDMDNHLWMTYMRYLQDPRHTPFKMLPGIPPPLGVCSRVARESKRTWKGPRMRNVSRAPPRLTPSDRMLHADSPDTIRQTHSGSATPTGSHMPKRQNSWPRSDASTRRRLRELCKMKPTLSAHYNRLLVTRSPSPFLNSSSSSRRGPNPNENKSDVPSYNTDVSFSTRDMSLSLFSTTSSAVSNMNQFTADSATPKSLAAAPHIAPAPRYNGHQKSQSLHLGMGMGSLYTSREGLASPFQPFHKPTALSNISSHSNMLQTPLAPIPQLASPLQLAAPLQPPRGSLKHYLGNDESSDTDRNAACAPFPDFDSHARHSALAGRRVRNRAVSMGDVSASSRRLSLMFEPPQLPPLPQTSSNAIATINAPSLHPPQFGSIRRLGSPFNEKPPRPLFNTFPRNFSLHGLEPTLESQEERQIGNESGMLPAFNFEDGRSSPKLL